MAAGVEEATGQAGLGEERPPLDESRPVLGSPSPREERGEREEELVEDTGREERAEDRRPRLREDPAVTTMA